MNTSPRVLLLQPSFAYHPEKNETVARYEQIPSLALHLFGALRQAKIPTEVLLLDEHFHGRGIELSIVCQAVADSLSNSTISHVVIPISDTESYNEFRNIDLGLLRALVQIPQVSKCQIILCGRILNEDALREQVAGAYSVVPVSYDEGAAVVAQICPTTVPERTRLVWDDTIEQTFHLSRIFAQRHAEHPVVLVGQRGCPFTCSFCERVLLWPQTKIVRSDPEEIAEAIRFYRDRYGRQHFMILDPVFNLDDTYVDSFCEKVGPLGVRWHAEMRVDRFRSEQVKKMQQAGCYRILIGVETFDEQVGQSIHKPIKVDAVRAAVAVCRENQVQEWLSFILGLGMSTRLAYRSAMKSAETVLQLGLGWSEGVPYFMYTGTRAYRERFGTENEGPFPVFYLPFPLIVMADLMVLFSNIRQRQWVELDGQKLRSFLDLGRLLLRDKNRKIDPQVLSQLAQNAGKEWLFKAIFENPARRELALRDLVMGWEQDQKPARYDFSEECRRYSLDIASIGPWP